MKKINIFLMLMAALLIASCSQDDENAQEGNSGENGQLVLITAGMPEEKDTRVSYTEDNGFKLTWDEGDMLILKAYENDRFIGYSKFLLVDGASTKTATFKGCLKYKATHYEVFYNTKNLEADENGNVNFNYTYQNQSGNQKRPTDHLKDYLYLSSDKITADVLTKGFAMHMHNAIVCLNIDGIHKNLKNLRMIAIETNSGEADAGQIAINVSGGFTYPCKMYISFDPASLKQTRGKLFKICMYGDRNAYLQTKATRDVIYQPGKRYYVNIGIKNEQGTLHDWIGMEDIEGGIGDIEIEDAY